MTGVPSSTNPVPNFYRASADDFKKIPGSPIAYWVSEILRKVYNNPSLKEFTISDGQNKTGNNAEFVREHWEISKDTIGLEKKWLFYAKGGLFRRWYGNIDEVVNWSHEAQIHYRKDHVSRIIPEYLWYKKGISWGLITSSKPSFRFLPIDATFDVIGSSIFFKDENDIYYSLGFLNTNLACYLLLINNPTLAFQVKNIRDVPYLQIFERKNVERIVDICINITKADWDSYETSWDFTTLPLLRAEYPDSGRTLEETYHTLRTHWQEQTLEMQRLEEENNRIFIEAYGLEDELTPDVPLSEITLTCNPHYRYNGNKTEEELEALLLTDTVKELISYAVGCMFGRYSLDTPGLVLANQGDDMAAYLAKVQVPGHASDSGASPSFLPDDDNIIPILDDEYFTDDIVTRFREFLKVTFGRETLAENLAFIAKTLSGKSSSSPEAVIRNYFLKQFYKDHLKMYKKRPIYWFFSSGKNQGFNALIYMHRYDKSTLSKMRTDYLLELESKLDATIEMLSQDAAKNKTRITNIRNQIEEIKAYDELLNNKALSLIEMDLDDGVVVNYAKFEGLVKDI